jgi:hypothetical protein
MLTEADVLVVCAELDGVCTNPRCTSNNCILAKPHFCAELGGVCSKPRCTRTHCAIAKLPPTKRRPGGFHGRKSLAERQGVSGSDRQKHPYRQIYRRNRLTPEEQRKANEGALAFGIFCIVIGVIVLIFSLMTGIKFR